MEDTTIGITMDVQEQRTNSLAIVDAKSIQVPHPCHSVSIESVFSSSFFSSIVADHINTPFSPSTLREEDPWEFSSINSWAIED